MSTYLYNIQYPDLNDNFGNNLKEVFDNINSNFQKLSSLGLTTGEAGSPSVWIPFNLNCVFCEKPGTGGPFTSSQSELQALLPGIESSYNKYYEITKKDRLTYQNECVNIYKALLNSLPNDTVTVSYTDDKGQKIIYKHKWELDYNILREDGRGMVFTPGSTSIVAKNNIAFLPGDIMVTGNTKTDIDGNISFIPVGTTAHIYIDPRFRNQYSFSEKVNTQALQSATDQSCVMYGNSENGEFRFKIVYAFPRIHCGSDGNFYLSVNGIDTNIPLTGQAGKDGSTARFAVVQLKDLNESDVRDMENMSTSGSGAKNYEVEKLIGSNTSLTDENVINQYDSQPAIVFPPDNFPYKYYYSLYWMTHLKKEGGKLTAYCSRENMVRIRLTDHALGGMMMDLDVYKKSVAEPVGQAPYYKPRGLMLPIGEIPSTWQDGLEQYTGVDKPEQFGAHLIYSNGKDQTNKSELHISAVKDYRVIGLPDNGEGVKPSQYKDNRTSLFLDIPTIITGSYNKNTQFRDATYDSNFFSNRFNVSDYKYSFENTDDAKKTAGLVVQEGGLITKWLYSESTIGAQHIQATENVYANRFIRKGAEDGQILLANGNSTRGNSKTKDSGAINLKIQYTNDIDNLKTDIPFISQENENDGQTYFQNEDFLKIPTLGFEFVAAQKFSWQNSTGVKTTPREGGMQICIGKESKNDFTNSNYNPALLNETLKSDPNLKNYLFVKGECGGKLCGVIASYKMGNLVWTRVLIAVNGINITDKEKSCGYGIPITCNGKDQICRAFNNLKMSCNTADGYGDLKVNNKVKPISNVSSYVGPMSSTNNKGRHDGATAGGVTLTIKTDGTIWMSAAAPNFMFTSNGCTDQERNWPYLDFNFIYPTGSINEDKIFYWCATSETISELSGVPDPDNEWYTKNQNWYLIKGTYSGSNDIKSLKLTATIVESGGNYSLKDETINLYLNGSKYPDPNKSDWEFDVILVSANNPTPDEPDRDEDITFQWDPKKSENYDIIDYLYQTDLLYTQRVQSQTVNQAPGFGSTTEPTDPDNGHIGAVIGSDGKYVLDDWSKNTLVDDSSPSGTGGDFNPSEGGGAGDNENPTISTTTTKTTSQTDGYFFGNFVDYVVDGGAGYIEGPHGSVSITMNKSPEGPYSGYLTVEAWDTNFSSKLYKSVEISVERNGKTDLDLDKEVVMKFAGSKITINNKTNQTQS